MAPRCLCCPARAALWRCQSGCPAVGAQSRHLHKSLFCPFEHRGSHIHGNLTAVPILSCECDANGRGPSSAFLRICSSKHKVTLVHTMSWMLEMECQTPSPSRVSRDVAALDCQLSPCPNPRHRSPPETSSDSKVAASGLLPTLLKSSFGTAGRLNPPLPVPATHLPSHPVRISPGSLIDTGKSDLSEEAPRQQSLQYAASSTSRQCTLLHRATDLQQAQP